MDLWIRSQNKGALIKVEMLGNTDGIIHSYSGVNKTILGEYKSDERAIEVLDEIQNILNPMIVFKNCNCTKDMLDKIKEVGACVVSDNSHIEQLSTCVYEMPKE